MLGRDDIIGQDHRERLLRQPAAWRTRPHGQGRARCAVGYRRWRRSPYWSSAGSRADLPCRPWRVFQFRRVIEIVLKRAFATRGDKDEFLDPGRPRLVDRILDQRPVNQRHDFFGDRLRCRQEPGAKTCNRKNRFGNLAPHSAEPRFRPENILAAAERDDSRWSRLNTTSLTSIGFRVTSRIPAGTLSGLAEPPDRDPRNQARPILASIASTTATSSGLLTSQNCRPRASASTQSTHRPCSRNRNCSSFSSVSKRADRPSADRPQGPRGGRHKPRHGGTPASARRRKVGAGERDDLFREVKRAVVGAKDRRRPADPSRPAVGKQTVQHRAVAAQDRGGDIGSGRRSQRSNQVLEEPGRRQRRVALQVDDDIVAPDQPVQRLGAALGAIAAVREVITTSAPKASDAAADPIIVSRDDNPVNAGDP